MNLAQIMLLTEASQNTIYRWIRERDFPRAHKGEWDEAAVRAWWAENEKRVGRWPEERR